MASGSNQVLGSSLRRVFSELLGLRTHRAALGMTLLLTLVFAAPVLIEGHVLLPHDNGFAMGVGTKSDIRMRKFDDIPNFFIPNIWHQTQGTGTSWNPHVELGMPVGFGIYGQASVAVWLAALFTDDPFRIHALISLLMVVLLATFSYLYLRGEGLLPAACFIGSIGIALGTRTAYWFGFAQFLAWVAGAMALLWVVSAFVRSRNVWWFLGIVAATYFTLTTGRPQAIVKALYFLVPYFAYQTIRHHEAWRDRLLTCMGWTAAATLGAVCALPRHLDLLNKALSSPRLSAPTDYFLKPTSESGWLADAAGTLSRLWDPWLQWDLSSVYPLNFNGMSFTPIYCLLFALGLTHKKVRQRRIFVSFVLLFLAMEIYRPLHEVFVTYLGFGFQRSNPIGGTLIPFFLFCGFAVDAWLRDRPNGSWSRTLIALGLCLGVAILVALADGVEAPNWRLSILVTAAITGLTLALVRLRTHRSHVALLLGILYLALYVIPLRHTISIEDLRFESPLLREVKASTEGGYRYAVFGNQRTLPSNQEVVHGLRSIHVYDPLMTQQYAEFAATISDSGLLSKYGKHFRALKSRDKLQADAFSYTGVNTIVAKRPLDLPGWTMKRVGRHLVHVANKAPVLHCRLASFTVLDAGDVEVDGALTPDRCLPLTAKALTSDQLNFSIPDVKQSTLLFVSAQYHPAWRAWCGEKKMETMRINGFYQGVRLPNQCNELVLEFPQTGRLAWVPAFLILLAFGGLTIRAQAGRWQPASKAQ